MTGGSGQGYGEMGNWNLGEELDLQYQLIGSWRHESDDGDYDIITFSSDGNFTLEIFYYDDYYGYYDSYSFSGTYTVQENQLLLFITTFEETITANFSISGNTLTLIINNEQTDYYRVN